MSEALPRAMKERDQPSVTALRIALAAVANAEAVAGDGVAPGRGAFGGDVERRNLSEDEIEAIVRGVHDEMRSDSDELRELGQEPEALKLADQAEVLERYLVDGRL
jgi:uncharacterized protein YqeY